MPILGGDALNQENRPLYGFVGVYDLHEHYHDDEVNRIDDILRKIKSITKSGVDSVWDQKFVLGFYAERRGLFLRSITAPHFPRLLQILYQGHRVVGNNDTNPESAMDHLIREFIHSAGHTVIETEVIPEAPHMISGGGYTISGNHDKTKQIQNHDFKDTTGPFIKYRHSRRYAWDDYDRLAKLSDKDLMEWYMAKMEGYRGCHSKWWTDETSTPVCAECQEPIDGPKQLIRIYRNSVHRICLPSFRQKRGPEKNPGFNMLLDRIQRLVSL